MRTSFLMALSAFLLVAACQDGQPSGQSSAHVGTYVLQTVDGEQLPVEIVFQRNVRLDSSAIELRADTTLEVRHTFYGITERFAGTYSMTDTLLQMRLDDQDVDPDPCILRADELLCRQRGQVWEYRR